MRPKDETLQRHYDIAVVQYQAKGRLLFTPGGAPNKGNSFSCRFWEGYDGIKRCSPGTLGHAFWMAGKDQKAKETR